ncbi:solute carrier family 25 (mitochondrial carrier protein), member 16 [Candida albicans P76067]|uniref:Mitochondrial thiamine pyrophosphate carrier 1 n=2 Tax=Candida albicans TaxID=5476 RepID=C4YIY3_CANAW|nr:mitochondrial carrier protein LEU5 [Candida albicans WO-1]KGQ96698.1 solute carrier family 25 (mitochondrial carrier protein), member 16 [Candida albicans P37005]KGR15884.1 solute carrier family 25 (mitochondrial carrier protein), member 16 [Candida albicans P78048]KGR22078.1 solute carrier family 25 (mitochondrial carrier protein), member 16 [Candida albicans P37037]KGT71020.1 solute carrier family 25 (mitochondrial carrier protein), member 16 [Candida albicans 12C]KHC37655.1 solute carrie
MTQSNSDSSSTGDVPNINTLLIPSTSKPVYSRIPIPGHLSNDQSTPIEDIKIIDKQSIDYIIRSGLAGGLAGSCAKTLVAPLDRIKILFQTSNPEFIKYRGTFGGFIDAGKRIWKADGVMGLYQGNSVTLLRIFPYAAIKFVAYEQIRTFLIPNDSYETAARRFMAGSLSGLASVFFTYPLDLVRVRLAFETRNLSHSQIHHHHKEFMAHRRGRIFSTVSLIYNENPPIKTTDPSWLKLMRKSFPSPINHLANFYRGFAPTILGMIPYAGVSFYTHDLLHDILRSKWLAKYTVQSTNHQNVVVKKKGKSSRESRAPLKAYAQLFAGGLAGLCSQTAAYPFEVIRRRMQVGGAINQGQFLSFKNTAKLIYRENGLQGFFVGLSIGYMKVVPMVACSFFVYERMKKFLGI